MLSISFHFPCLHSLACKREKREQNIMHVLQVKHTHTNARTHVRTLKI